MPHWFAQICHIAHRLRPPSQLHAIFIGRARETEAPAVYVADPRGLADAIPAFVGKWEKGENHPMAKRHDFDELFSHYPTIISEMDEVFGSHVFILTLRSATNASTLKRARHREGNEPFRQVHAILTDQLNKLPELVRLIEHRPSLNIFDDVQGCAFWQKLAATR